MARSATVKKSVTKMSTSMKTVIKAKNVGKAFMSKALGKASASKAAVSKILASKTSASKTAASKKTSAMKKTATKKTAIKKTVGKKAVGKSAAKTSASKSAAMTKAIAKKAVNKVSVVKNPVSAATNKMFGDKAATANKMTEAPAVKVLEVGSAVPSFSMPATVLGTVSDASLKGSPYVLYFYPKDKTSGCTAQASGFQEALGEFTEANVKIVGVSKDSIPSHRAFAEQYNLAFPLASDTDTGVAETFGCWAEKSMYGRSYMGMERSTFLVDGEGVIRAIWRKVDVPGHVDAVKKAALDL